MPENSPSPRYRHGEPCWADVQTLDVQAAKAFYAAVFGWTFQDLPTPDGRSYAQAFADGDLVATVAPLSPHRAALGTAAQWNIYFAAEDAAALAGEVPHAGGAVQFGPEEIGDTGVMVFMDPPGGGTTGVWQPGTHTGTARYNEPGALSWTELLTPEPQAAVGFFQQLFGHEVTEYPQDDGGTYSTLMVNGAEVAGIVAAEAPARWQIYFGVADVADAVGKAVAAGGEVLIAPEAEDDETPGATATLRDPQGGVFSLLEV
ncbi:VOC family protein [Pseudarthrobacter sulfonivorans]|uniref:VOC family protein n=1 Tax=Pseudarthrobacter sulfonivorans TaxID=121292 RepID=UPI0021080510|nr:VOC family protein [Pseudarthrobacter sulfonivorans]